MVDIKRIEQRLGDNRPVSDSPEESLRVYIDREMTPVLAKCRDKINELVDAHNALEARVAALEP